MFLLHITLHKYVPENNEKMANVTFHSGVLLTIKNITDNLSILSIYDRIFYCYFIVNMHDKPLNKRKLQVRFFFLLFQISVPW